MPDLAPLLIFAAFEKLRQIPLQFWINLGLCALALIMVIRFWRALREINSFMPWLATMIAAAMILSYWTYNRNEPRFLTPFVDKLTLVLPTKAKHDADLERLRRSRD
ncbi:MAG: hypothetical protein H7A44_04600 [Opitutaceae bacterium]|nr:hypothetical protein [Cephaloticoccus sp.]MCP5529702.1 hypothetical protein [Opitutaceae bacterium]